MELRLILTLAACFGMACSGDDDPGGFTTSGTGASMTMTLTTFTSVTQGPAETGTTGTTTAGTTEDQADSTTGEAAPACPGACVELAPRGWNGPVATADSDPAVVAPACPPEFPDVALEAFEDFAADPAECGCECGPVAGAVCNPLATLRDYGNSEDCGGPVVNSFALTNGQCQSASIANSSFIRLDPVEILNLGACQPTPAVALPEPEPGARVTACTAEVSAGSSCDQMEGMGCLAQLPLDPLDPQVCIWREGEHDCPKGSAYAQDRVVYGNFADDRACSDCDCDEPVGVCDNSSASVYSIGGCAVGISGTATGTGFCTQIGTAALGARYIVGAAVAFCPALPVEASGEVTATEPTTLCCTR